jgi:serine/threonine protein kinase
MTESRPPGDVTLALAGESAMAPSDLPRGSMVGEYRVTGILGEGGMGKVYAGVHPLIGRKVAIKVISRALSRSDEGTARFLQEARAATALHHRNIVDVFAFGQLPDGRHYQVMELLEGETLRKALDGRGALRLSQTRVIVRAILSALDTAHRGGIIHRDIKPDNVFVTGSLDGPPEDIEVRILDFGLAKQQSPAADAPAVVTRLGFPMGTPAYMSPEQCRGVSSIDARADLYAAGVVLYEMLTGRVPFQSDAALEVMTMQIGQPAPPPSTVTPVPLALEQVVLRALAKQPGERYESAAEMLAAFETACRATPDWHPRAATPEHHAQLGIGATWPSATAARTPGLPSVASPMLTPVSAPPPAPARRTPWLVLGAVVVAGLLAFALTRPRARPAEVLVPPEPLPVAAPVPPPAEVAPRPEPEPPRPALEPRRPAKTPARKVRTRITKQETDVEAPINPYKR